ncbi:hypothetical protein EIP86_006674 [Pleurotus ostreatoroseus]|nr:hypothetical protein EIP86_006674 [Pleurotus ostreatoroseus]
MYVLELILTIIYMIALMIYEHVYITKYPNYLVVDWANDAGFIAAGQFPLATTLAMKNGALQMLTGMSHEKLNLMHRVVARATFLLTWMHGFGWVGYEAHYIVAKPWIIYGLVAGITFSIVFFMAWEPFRKRFYEYFVLSHNIFILLTIVFTYLHCVPVDCAGYIWACFVVWGFDRACRWIRYTLLSNFFSKNSCRAHCELIDDDTIRVTTKRTFYMPLSWKYPSLLPGAPWQGGQHCFLAFPTIGPLESHPMTIATIPEGDGRDQKMMWIMRTRKGLTRRLKHWLEKQGGNGDIPLMLDGPYGAPQDLTPYATAIFLAVHLNWIQDELSKALTSLPTNIQFTAHVYITGPSSSTDTGPQTPTSEVSSLHSLPKKTVSEDGDRDMCAYTDPEKCTSDASGVGELHLEGLQIYSGRPDLPKIIEETVLKCPGPVSVDVSGPTPFVASVRQALSSPWASASAVFKGMAPVIELNVEDFTM